MTGGSLATLVATPGFSVDAEFWRMVIAAACGVATPTVTSWFAQRGKRGETAQAAQTQQASAEFDRRARREDAFEARREEERAELRRDLEKCETTCDTWRERATVEREQRLLYAALLQRHGIPTDGTPPFGVSPIRAGLPPPPPSA